MVQDLNEKKKVLLKNWKRELVGKKINNWLFSRNQHKLKHTTISMMISSFIAWALINIHVYKGSYSHYTEKKMIQALMCISIPVYFY